MITIEKIKKQVDEFSEKLRKQGMKIPERETWMQPEDFLALEKFRKAKALEDKRKEAQVVINRGFHLERKIENNLEAIEDRKAEIKACEKALKKLGFTENKKAEAWNRWTNPKLEAVMKPTPAERAAEKEKERLHAEEMKRNGFRWDPEADNGYGGKGAWVMTEKEKERRKTLADMQFIAMRQKLWGGK